MRNTLAVSILSACSVEEEYTKPSVETATEYLKEGKAGWGDELLSAELRLQPDGSYEGMANIKDEDGSVEDWECRVSLPTKNGETTSSNYTCHQD
ncbi:hypothetical protein A8B75_19735 [Sphingomonadales bacterium EhC05]|nr:hypothetical protein A8B75_19735 [Sphingomonadales bacterium EhC05]